MSKVDDLERLAMLHKEGAITDDEFAEAKSAVLSGVTAGRSKSRWGVWVVLILAIFAAIVFFVGSSPEAKEKAIARGAIDLCWEDYKTSRVSLDARKFIADTCQIMERDFKEKYRVSP